MLRAVILFAFVVFGLNLCGQTVYDKDFKLLPRLDLSRLDGVKRVKAYEVTAGALIREPIERSGYLVSEVTLDTLQRIIRFDAYSGLTEVLEGSYQFFYEEEGVVRVEQLYSSKPKKYQWVLKDSLIQEIKLLKGAKNKPIAHWIYSYRDTIPTTTIKYDRLGNVVLEIQYEYSDDHKLKHRVVKQQGKADQWLIANYDSEGNLTDYKSYEDKPSWQGEEVAIERDSSNQVNAVNIKNSSGKVERWAYTNNEEGKTLEARLLNEFGEEVRRVEYTYDSSGNETMQVVIQKAKVKEKRERKYDEYGNQISMHYYRNVLGELGLKTYFLMAYDEGQRLIRRDYWNKDFNLRKRWDYEYELY